MKDDIIKLNKQYPDYEIRLRHDVYKDGTTESFNIIAESKKNHNYGYESYENDFNLALRIIKEKLTPSGGFMIITLDGKEIKRHDMSIFEKKKYLETTNTTFNLYVNDCDVACCNGVFLKEYDPNIYFAVIKKV